MLATSGRFLQSGSDACYKVGDRHSIPQSGRLSLNCLDKMGVTLCQRSSAREVRGHSKAMIVDPDFFLQCSRFWCNQILGKNLQIVFRPALLQNISDQQCSVFRVWCTVSQAAISILEIKMPATRCLQSLF